MRDRMKSYLMHRDNNPRYGVVEWWKTMINSDERREVAEKLREVTDEEYDLVFIEEILEGILGGCLDDEGQISNKKILGRLADLIDPRCYNVHTRAPNGGFCCSTCLFLYEPTDETVYRGTFKYCPRCGARVTSGGEG